MLIIQYTKQMERDLDRMKRQGKDIRKLAAITNQLAAGQLLPKKNKDHKLKGKWAGMRECHIEANWLLIYQVIEDKLVLSCMATGTHDDLFKE